MDKQLKEKEWEGDVTYGNFPLSKSPVDYQLTIHINNLLNTYPEARKYILDSFKERLCKSNIPTSIKSDLVIQQLIDFYGQRRFRAWFKLVYGWEFKRKSVS